MHNPSNDSHQFFTRPFLFALCLMPAFAAGPGCSESSNPEQNAQTTAQPIPAPSRQVAALTRVESHLVCMVNDQFFGKQQIPVKVEDRIYYGCCDMCEAKIRQNASVRLAVDPVSHRSVDKALAVIGALADGTVYYFESEQNMRTFRPPAGS